MPTQTVDILYPLILASLAQSVEHSAVNRVVVGSSPTGGAKTESTPKGVLFVLPFHIEIKPGRIQG